MVIMKARLIVVTVKHHTSFAHDSEQRSSNHRRMTTGRFWCPWLIQLRNISVSTSRNYFQELKSLAHFIFSAVQVLHNICQAVIVHLVKDLLIVYSTSHS